MTEQFPQPIDVRLDATMTKDDTSGWTCVLTPGSAERFGTGKAIKVAGTHDGHPIEATMLPTGGGTHMMPVMAALRKTLGKGVGDAVSVHLTERRT